MTPPDRRSPPQASGRRQTDRLVEYRLDLLERLPEDLSRAMAVRLDEIRAWIKDEREARRHHDAELDDRIDEIRREVKADLKAMEDHVDDRFDECGKAIEAVGTDQKAGRRTILVSLISAAALIIAAVVTSGGAHP